MGACQPPSRNAPNEKELSMNTPVSKLDPSNDFIRSISKSLCIIEIQPSFYSGFLMQLFNKKTYRLRLDAKFDIIDNFLEINLRLSYRILLFNHFPRIIQPRKIVLPIKNAIDFLDYISML
jgi:hypothetical protein